VYYTCCCAAGVVRAADWCYYPAGVRWRRQQAIAAAYPWRQESYRKAANLRRQRGIGATIDTIVRSLQYAAKRTQSHFVAYFKHFGLLYAALYIYRFALVTNITYEHADVLLCAASSCACVQPVSGVVTVLVAPGKRVEHLGIKVEMIGQIGMCLFVQG
jgi:Vacuolar protein sorting-associated protein 26